MPELEISELASDDWEVFRDLRLAALREAPYAFGSRYADWVDAPEDRWRARLDQVELNVIAVVDGSPAGMASGCPADGGAELISMWVAPSSRGCGVSGRLIDAVASWADHRGLPLHLMVRDDNPAAIAAYLAARFVDRGVPPGQDPLEPPERLMERPHDEH